MYQFIIFSLHCISFISYLICSIYNAILFYYSISSNENIQAIVHLGKKINLNIFVLLSKFNLKILSTKHK